MAEQDQAERTEPATPKRREDARERGEVAQSRELGSVLVLAASLSAGLVVVGGGLSAAMVGLAREMWGGQASAPQGLWGYHALLWKQSLPVAQAMLPVMAAAMIAGAAGPLVQTGPLFASKALKFRLDRISLVKGFKRFGNVDRLFDLVKSLVKVVIVIGIAWAVVISQADRILGLTGVGPATALLEARGLALRIAGFALLALLLAAILDVLYQRMRFEKRLRMSRREVREESKQREGNPLVRARFRSIHRELNRQRMIAEVSTADVVITNPTHYAVALRYESGGMAAPQVVAKGRNHVAQRIRDEAAQHRVPIVENPPVARLIYKTTDVGREIPENLYQAVAEVLAYVHRLGRSPASWSAS